jgi:CheY-like chemotaxis protein
MTDMLPSRRWRILVIDDDPSVLRGLMRLILAEGHLVDIELHGRTALERIAGGDSYDLILCDISLPDLDGPGLYEEVEGRWPHLVSRFIFMTGDATRHVEGRRAFFERTRVPVVLKPFGREDLLRAIRAVGSGDVE